MMTRTRPRTSPRTAPRTLGVLLAGALVAGSLVAACGGGASGAPGPTSPAGSAAGSAGSTGSAVATPATPGAGPAADDPKRRLTAAECTEAVDHALGLFANDPAMADAVASLREHRGEMVSECGKTGTLRDYRCLMAAKSAQEMGQCPQPGAE